MAQLVPGVQTPAHRDFRDPKWDWGQGPQAPNHPPGQPRKPQIVWPRDKKQKGAHTWDRWKDLFSGKGPDMWVGRQGDNGPNRQAWSHWGYGHGGDAFDNLGYRDKRDGGPEGPDGWNSWMGNRSVEKKYDFNTRRYAIPHDEMWSDIKWDRKGKTWLYLRDSHGNKETRDAFLELQDPLEALWYHHNNIGPFDYDPRKPHWDWHFNEKPYNWWPKTNEYWSWAALHGV
ncbi:MAG: hypothetical protein Q9212_005082 [Teloschistes hypoglaucus]